MVGKGLENGGRREMLVGHVEPDGIDERMEAYGVARERLYIDIDTMKSQ